MINLQHHWHAIQDWSARNHDLELALFYAWLIVTILVYSAVKGITRQEYKFRSKIYTWKTARWCIFVSITWPVQLVFYACYGICKLVNDLYKSATAINFNTEEPPKWL